MHKPKLPNVQTVLLLTVSVSLTWMPNLTKLEMARALTIGQNQHILTIGNCMKAQQLTYVVSILDYSSYVLCYTDYDYQNHLVQ